MQILRIVSALTLFVHFDAYLNDTRDKQPSIFTVWYLFHIVVIFSCCTTINTLEGL